MSGLDPRDQVVADLVNAVLFYGDPENYHAVAFLFDRPCGGFADDFAEDHEHPDYERPMPGAKARDVLRRHFDELVPLMDRYDAAQGDTDG